jgi:SEC-C motif-containing protein
MRSRYVAFALGLVDYAVSTSHPPQDAEGVRVFHENTRFLGLSISEHVDPGPGSAPGFVTFTATLEQGGQDASFTERSRFERRGGCWFYVGGERLEG